MRKSRLFALALLLVTIFGTGPIWAAPKTVAMPVAPAFIKTSDFQQFIQKLGKTLKRGFATGIAAPEAGFDLRVFLIRKGFFQFQAYINPSIKYVDTEATVRSEVCLTTPKTRQSVHRCKEIEISYLDQNGVAQVERLVGLKAIVAQQKFDILEGVDASEKASARLQLERTNTYFIAGFESAVRYLESLPETDESIRHMQFFNLIINQMTANNSAASVLVSGNNYSIQATFDELFFLLKLLTASDLDNEAVQRWVRTDAHKDLVSDWARQTRDPKLSQLVTDKGAYYGGELEFRHDLFKIGKAFKAFTNSCSIMGVIGGIGLCQSGPFAEGLLLGSTSLSAFLFAKDAGGAPFDIPIGRLLIKRWTSKIFELCDGCKISRTTSRGYGTLFNMATRITYPDGWWMEFIVDPEVIEVKHLRSRAYSIRTISERLQKHLFDTGLALGLSPSQEADNMSASHINIGMDVFQGRGLMFRNFLVDFHNHPELSTGVWLDDQANAPVLEGSARLNFREAIARFDALPMAEQTIEGLLKLLAKHGYKKHYSALSIRNADASTPDAEQRLELRAMRAMLSANHLAFVSGLLDQRLAWVAKQGSPIPVLDVGPKLSDYEKRVRYHAYIEESKADWGEASLYLTDRIKYARPSRGLDFRSCVELLFLPESKGSSKGK